MAIRTLVAEDSPVQRELLLFLLEEDGRFEIVGTAVNGAEAVEMAARLRPDVVLMDYHMPKLDGAEATRQIMMQTPVPIVITSASLLADDQVPTFDALQAGALAVTLKPVDLDSPGHDQLVERLLRTLVLMSEVKVVRRWPKVREALAADSVRQNARRPTEVIAIGGSTGAPTVIGTILSSLSAETTPPILLVQHMAPGFSSGFATWLDQKTALTVRLASNGTTPLPGCVYVGPDGWHLTMAADRKIRLRSCAGDAGFCPSVNSLFLSAAEVYESAALGIILTGMGQDGVAGLQELHRRGAVTVAQDEASCVVFGMPREAIRCNAVRHVLSPEEIANLIGRITPKRGGCDATRR